MHFYGVKIADHKLSSCFGLMRFLCEPDFLREAHITLRGPYKTPIDKKTKADVNLALNDVRIVAPDKFYSNKQNTVLFRCVIENLDKIWRKPDFPAGIPHLTVYDGNDRTFSDKVLSILDIFNWETQVHVTELQKIDEKRNISEEFIFMYEDFLKIAKNVNHKITNLSDICNMLESDRLETLKNLCEYTQNYIQV